MSEELLFTNTDSDAPAKRTRKPKASTETSTDAPSMPAQAVNTPAKKASAKRAGPKTLAEVAALQSKSAESTENTSSPQKNKRTRAAQPSAEAPGQSPSNEAPAAVRHAEPTPAPAPVYAPAPVAPPIQRHAPETFAPAPSAPAASDTVSRILAAAAETVRSSPTHHGHHSPSAKAPAYVASPPPIPEPPPLPDYIPGAAPLKPEMIAARPQHGQPGAPSQEVGDGGFERGGRRGERRRRRGRNRDRDRGERQGQPAQPGDPSQPNGNQGRHQQGNGQHPQGGPQRQPQQGQRQPQQDANDEERDRIDPQQPLGPPEPAEGLLELSPKGFGFLRLRDKLYAQLPSDVFVSADLIRKYGLREAMNLKGEAARGHRGLQMTAITEVNGVPPADVLHLPLFEELKAINPNKRYQLETTKERLTTRVIDMMTPVGRGQRGLIVAPPRAGKTTLLQHVAEAIIANYPQVHLMILLVDERPEEVTEFRRVLTNAEIFASSNDSDTKSHTRISTFAIERAKRLVEQGQHVFMLMDSITRLARAFNNAKQGGATGSGGMGVGAMEIPRRLFAAARNTRTAGSLTILATALIETGSRMDDVIFQEFKGTGNMELVLDRKIAEQYIYPAVNIFKSGTRREELLLPAFQIEKIHMLRRGLGGHKPIEAIQRVISLQERYPNNAQLLMELPSK